MISEGEADITIFDVLSLLKTDKVVNIVKQYVMDWGILLYSLTNVHTKKKHKLFLYGFKDKQSQFLSISIS